MHKDGDFITNKQRRFEDAQRKKKAGYRAYSDAFNHVIVSYGGDERGYDLACAIQLRDALDKAIISASTPDDRYT